MGGYGSGRSGSRVTVEGTSSIILSVHWMRRSGVIQPNANIRATLKNERLDLIAFANASPCSGELHLAGEVETLSHGRFEINQRISLATTPGTLGGLRWWFICPVSGRRVAKLYLPNGATRFASRRAYRLAYQCQRETAWDRALRRTRKLNMAVGGDGGDECPIKPKWMRWATYERNYLAWEAAEQRADLLFAGHVARFLELEKTLGG